MDQERQELIDTIKLLTEAISEMTPSLTRTAKTINDFNKTIHGADDAFDDFENSIHEADNAIKNEARQKREAAKDAKIAEQARAQAFDNSTKAAVNALTSFADTIFFSSEKGFSKFSGSLNSAGDAAFELGKSFGGLGLIIGGLIKATTAVVGAHLEQADAVFKSRNELFSFAGAASMGSNEFLDLGQNLGFTSKQLDSIIKPLKSMGPTLLSLGDSAGEGAKRFLELSVVSDETRERFIRMGVMPEELLQSQADYINLQRLSGNQAAMRLKTDKQIQEESLQYAESLKVLSELTGEDAETVKKRQEAALNDFRFQAKLAQMNAEAAELELKGDAESVEAAKKLRANVKNMQDSIAIAAALSPEMAEQAKSLILTEGNITDFTSNLAVAGVNTQEFAKAMESGDPDAMLNFLQDVMDSTADQAERFGEMVGYMSDEQLNSLGINRGSMDLLTKYQQEGMSLAEAVKKIREGLATTGEEGTDPLADSQAKLITAQMELAVEFDNLLQETSPLMQGFNSTTIAVTALGAAAAAAAVVMGGFAIKRGVGSILGGGGGRSGGTDIPDIPNIPESTGKAVGSLGAGLRGAGTASAYIALGGAAIGAAIAAIGAGIAGAAWLTGKAFPTFVEGLESFEELDGSKLVDAAKGMTAIGAALAVMGTGAGIGGLLGGIGALFNKIPGASPIEQLKEFQEYDLDAPKITKNAEAITAYSNAMSALSDAPSGGVGLIEAAANGILGMFGVNQSMPWDKMVEFGNITLPTEKIKANSEAVTAYAIAMAKLTTVNGLESFGNMAAGIFDGIGNWARGTASLPWDDMMTFAGLSIPGTLESNVEKLGKFGEAIAKVPEIPIRREGGKLDVIASYLSGSVQMPWDTLKTFSEVTFTKDQSTNIIRNAELLGAFGEAVSKVPEIPTSTTSGGKLDVIASYLSGSVQMPWDTLKTFSEVTFTEEAAEKIATNANILKVFGEALSTMPQDIKGIEIDGGWFSDDLLMPWDLMKTFSSETFEEDKIKSNSAVLKEFGEALAAIPEITLMNIDENSMLPWDLLKLLIDSGIADNSQSIDDATQTIVSVYDKLKDIPEIKITFSEESKTNFDRLISSLDDFSNLHSDDIMKNLDALQRFQTTTSLVRAPESQVNVTPNSQIVSAISNTNENVSGPTNANINQTSVTTTSNSVDINEQLITMLSQKLDTVINILGDSVDIQDRSFRYNSV